MHTHSHSNSHKHTRTHTHTHAHTHNTHAPEFQAFHTGMIVVNDLKFSNICVALDNCSFINCSYPEAIEMEVEMAKNDCFYINNAPSEMGVRALSFASGNRASATGGSCTHKHTDMHIHVHTCTYMYIHVHTCTYMYMYVHTCTCMYIHVYTCTYILMHTSMTPYVVKHMHLQTFILEHAHACPYTYIVRTNTCYG